MSSNFNGGYAYHFNVTEDFHLLCMLSNIGIINPQKSLTTEEISVHTMIDTSTVKRLLSKLIQEGYVKSP